MNGSTECIGWRNGDSFSKKFGSRVNTLDINELKKIPIDFLSPNGGLIYIQFIKNWENCLEYGKNFIRSFTNYAGGIDELAIAWIAFGCYLTIFHLDGKIYNSFPQMCSNKSKIIHFMGEKNKPWNNEFMQNVFVEWFKYYTLSKKIYEFDNSEVIEFNNIGGFVKRKLNEICWLEFLTKTEFKLPSDLKMIYNFENDWLVFEFKESIYFELKFNQYSVGFIVRCWIKNKNVSTDLRIRDDIKKILSRNKKFSFMEDSRGLYLFISKEKVKMSSYYLIIFIRIFVNY